MFHCDIYVLSALDLYIPLTGLPASSPPSVVSSLLVGFKGVSSVWLTSLDIVKIRIYNQWRHYIPDTQIMSETHKLIVQDSKDCGTISRSLQAKTVTVKLTAIALFHPKPSLLLGRERVWRLAQEVNDRARMRTRSVVCAWARSIGAVPRETLEKNS